MGSHKRKKLNRERRVDELLEKDTGVGERDRGLLERRVIINWRDLIQGAEGWVH